MKMFFRLVVVMTLFTVGAAWGVHYMITIVGDLVGPCFAALGKAG